MLGNSILWRKYIEAKDAEQNKFHHLNRHTVEWLGAADSLRLFFDCLDVSSDVSNMLIVGSNVEVDAICKACVVAFKFAIGNTVVTLKNAKCKN